MKTFIKRALSVIMIGAMSAALLVGCGGKGGNGSGSAWLKVMLRLRWTREASAWVRRDCTHYVMRSTYESYYGADIWNMEVEEGKTFGDSLKEMGDTTARPDDSFKQPGRGLRALHWMKRIIKPLRNM